MASTPLVEQCLTYRRLGIHHLMVLAPPLGICAATDSRILLLKASVLTPCGCGCTVEQLGTRRNRGIPVEGHSLVARANAHLIACGRPGSPEGILNSQSRQTVSKITDGFVVVEIRLFDPAFWLGAGHSEPHIAVAVFHTLNVEFTLPATHVAGTPTPAALL